MSEVEDKLPDDAQMARVNPLASDVETLLVIRSSLGVNWTIFDEMSVELNGQDGINAQTAGQTLV
jgi:hypothetical protein